MLKDLESQHVMHTYNRFDVVLDRGEGCYIYDNYGKKYLDMGSGIAVNSLGYSHPKLMKSLEGQLHKLMHTSNLYYTKPQIETAALLAKYSGFKKVFFCNSGTEANEAAIKIARKHGVGQSPTKTQMISMTGGFHGRTYGALTATAQEKYQAPFKPMVPGFNYVEYNNIEQLKQVITHDTCGVILEVIQGESGIHVADKCYLQEVMKLCHDYNALLIIDEVQTGVGRTGSLFAYSQFDIEPDVITTAKGLGAGLPIGAVLVKEKADVLVPGDHGTTFGGNLMATTAAQVVVGELCGNNLLQHVQEIGNYLKEKLECLKKRKNEVVDVRGMGLMIGIELSIPARYVINQCIEEGLLVIGAGENVIRFLPPLIIEKQHVDEAVTLLEKVIEQYS